MRILKQVLSTDLQVEIDHLVCYDFYGLGFCKFSVCCVEREGSRLTSYGCRSMVALCSCTFFGNELRSSNQNRIQLMFRVLKDTSDCIFVLISESYIHHC
ncbi:hypothetical protein Hanom_Chr09g00818531 [Helianthus anomalus]